MMYFSKRFRIAVVFLIVFFLLSNTACAGTPKLLYYNAESSYKQLLKDRNQQKYRHNWLNCIKKFEKVYTAEPDGPWAAAGMYKKGILYAKLSNWSNREADRKEAIDILTRLIKQYPKSRYRPKAARIINRISKNRASTAASTKHITRMPGLKPKEGTEEPEPMLAAQKAGPMQLKGVYSTVQDLRFWSNPNYTRVVIDTDNETDYTHHLLKRDPSISKPQRLYVDLKGSRLGKTFDKIKQIDDHLLKNARAGQYTADTVRVVIDIKSFKNYKIFSLKNPFRIVIDVWGNKAESVRYAKKSVPRDGYHTPRKAKIAPSAIARQLALGVQTIVIDPGHGGHDYGAPGYIKGTHEKNIVLKIAKKLARKLKKTTNCDVILTRKTDRFLTLEERTAIANTKNADLFISIHTNAARNRHAYGMETYFLNLATDDEAILVAAKENATSTKNISDLQSILMDLMQNAKINESSRLAGYVQDSMYKHLRRKYNRIKSKGVKQAPFYVLLGAQMPAILVETAFISNSRECKRLMNATYQERLTDSILKGIQKYIEETNPTAFIKGKPDKRS